MEEHEEVLRQFSVGKATRIDVGQSRYRLRIAMLALDSRSSPSESAEDEYALREDIKSGLLIPPEEIRPAKRGTAAWKSRIAEAKRRKATVA